MKVHDLKPAEGSRKGRKRVGRGIGSNPGVINKARQSAFGAGVPLNAVSVSPLRVTLWCDRPHVDNLTKALHKTFVE